MKVKVKDGMKGFFGTRLRRGADPDDENSVSDEFEIKPRTHSTKTDEDGEPLVISEEEQFSGKWMVRLDKPRVKPGPKPKTSE